MSAPDLAELRRRAARIPSQGGHDLGDVLEAAAASVPPGEAVVECGCWLGAGTAHLSIGASRSGATVHVFDNWRGTHADYAARFGASFRNGRDILPLARRYLDGFPGLTFHKGEIQHARWVGPAVGTYVDDACKTGEVWRAAMRTFRPWFADGCIVVLMDFYYGRKKGDGKYKAQERYMAGPEGEAFSLVQEPGGCCAVFEYRKE